MLGEVIELRDHFLDFQILLRTIEEKLYRKIFR